MADFKAFSPTAWRAFQDKCAALFPFLKKTWQGTREAWGLLSSAEQAHYDIVNFTDDTADGGAVVVDEVTAGNLNAVTSNAVASAIEPLGATAFKITVGGGNFDTVRTALGLTYPAVFKFEAVGSQTNTLYGTGVLYRESASAAPSVSGYLTNDFIINTNNAGTFQIFRGSTAITDATIVCTKVR